MPHLPFCGGGYYQQGGAKQGKKATHHMGGRIYYFVGYVNAPVLTVVRKVPGIICFFHAVMLPNLKCFSNAHKYFYSLSVGNGFRPFPDNFPKINRISITFRVYE